MVVDIPRATWLRGPRMNIELRGNLEIIKDPKTIRLKGFLSVEQGTYEFYGKKFVVSEGRLDFDGGEKIDPTVYLEIEHTMKREDSEDLLEIQIRGIASNAQIEFFFNRDKISEGDAISYILFGKKTDQLNYGQKTTMSDVGNILAKDLAANLINSQLSTSLGETLGLDVVKVSGEDNWNKATLTAGKYVTNDIYVAYERGITQSGSSNVLFESALFEYYIARFVYLRFVEATDKTSGVDLLLRFE
jgi:translocation and assembly module TamB